MSDPLEQLLRSVDASSPPPVTGDVAAGIRGRFARRRRFRLAAGALATTTAIVLLAAVAVLRTRSEPPASPAVALAPRSKPVPPTQAVALSEQTVARIRELTVARLEGRRAPGRPTLTIATTAATPSPRELRDRAALILIYDADRYHRASRRTDAIAAYQRAIDLFPQSPWAEVARERLKQM